MPRLSCAVVGVLVLSLAGCTDNPTSPTNDGAIQVSVVAATTEIVMSGQEVPVTATVITDRGRPYPAFLLNFNVLEGGGRMFGGAELTNSKGVARDIWTIGFSSCQINTLAVRAVDAATGVGTTYFTQTVATPGKISFYRRGDDGQAAVYVMNVDGSNQTRLASNVGFGSSTDWSPDGRRIVFDGSGGLQIMNEDGSNKTFLTNGNSPAWSYKGDWIAFSRLVDGQSDIFVMLADGSYLRNVTNTPDYNEGNPDMSPDRNRIVYSSDEGAFLAIPREGATASEIWVTDGLTGTRLTSDGASATNPAWSPDGSKIAFDRNVAGVGESEIFVMDADGSDQHNLTNSPRGDTWPDWSPDGSRIVFNSNRGAGNDYDIYVMNADGSNPTNLTNVPTAHNARAAWSRCVPF